MTRSTQRGLVRLLLVTTALATAGHAYAQETIALGEIVVEADGTGSEYAAVQTTAGSKLSVAITEVPQSVSVVSRAQLDKIPGAKADEALRYTAGVQPSTYGTDADFDWIRIRGFQADGTGIMQDNLPLYQYGFGSFLIEPFLLESIDVLKGPSSALYGGGNVGGVINYVTKRATGERLRYTETGVNNFGNAYVGFDVGDGTESGDLAYRLTGKLSGGGWETEDAKDIKGSVLGSVTWTPSDATSLTIYGQYQAGDLTHTSTGFLPYAGTVVDAANGTRIPRDLNYGDPNFDSYDRQQFMVGYELEHDLNDNWTVRQNARLAGVSLDEQYLYTYGELTADNTLDRIAFEHNTDILNFAIDTQIAGTVQTGVVEHTLLAGIDYKNVGFGQTQASDGTYASPVRVPPIDVLDPEYGVVFPDLYQYLEQDITLQQVGIYAQDQMKVGNFIATVNGRYDFTGIDTEGVNYGAPIDATSSEGAFTGRLGLGYEFDNGLTPYVSYGTSFNPTIATTPSGELLPAEEGRQIEVGVKYEPTYVDGLITASLFHIERENYSQTLPDNSGAEAIGQVNVLGAELEGNVTFDRVTVFGALTLLDAEIIDDVRTDRIGKTPVQIPELTASLGVEYAFEDNLDGLVIGAGVRVLGESWTSDAVTKVIDTKVPTTTLFDASLRYEKDDWGVALNASNILDTSYVSSCQTTQVCGYGAGRTITLSVHKKW